MFGHQDDEQAEHASAATASPAASNHSSDNNQQTHDDSSGDYLNSLSSETLDQDHPEASEPADGGNSDDSASHDHDQFSDKSDTSDTPLADDNLLEIKKQALNELSPLVSHLDQSPEEKFKTTMMMIQAADNQALIPDAYTAAKEISNEKARAQALLDIVNEINYFTHQAA